jgi:hypothetical protein
MQHFQPGFKFEQQPSDEVRAKTRAAFCEELRQRGFVFVRVPRRYRYWQAIDAAYSAANIWFYSLTWAEKGKCSYRKEGAKCPVLGYKKEQGREFLEVRTKA